LISGLGLGLGLETSGLGLEAFGLETPGLVNIPVRQPKYGDYTKPGVSRHKNSTVERTCPSGTLSCCGATVSEETAQLVLDHYQTFYKQSVEK